MLWCRKQTEINREFLGIPKIVQIWTFRMYSAVAWLAGLEGNSWRRISWSTNISVFQWLRLTGKYYQLQFVQPLSLQYSPLRLLPTSQHRILTQKKERWIVKVNDKIMIWETTQKKRGFEFKSAIDCGTEPYDILSPNTASAELVDHKSVVQLNLQATVQRKSHSN